MLGIGLREIIVLLLILSALGVITGGWSWQQLSNAWQSETGQQLQADATCWAGVVLLTPIYNIGGYSLALPLGFDDIAVAILFTVVIGSIIAKIKGGMPKKYWILLFLIGLWIQKLAGAILIYLSGKPEQCMQYAFSLTEIANPAILLLFAVAMGWLVWKVIKR